MTQDVHRQQQFEMFLGIHRERHFPSCAAAGGSGSQGLSGGGSAVSGGALAGSVGGGGSGVVESFGSSAAAVAATTATGVSSPPLQPQGASSLSSSVGSLASPVAPPTAAVGAVDGLAVLSRPPGTAVLLAPPFMGPGPALAPPEALLGAGTSTASSPLWVCPRGVTTARLVLWQGSTRSINRWT
jgi:hypothetical protein